MSATETLELQPNPALHIYSASHGRDSHDRSREIFTHGGAPNRIDVDEPPIPSASDRRAASTLRTSLIILQPSLINLLSSFTNGLITVGLPVIARSIALPRTLYLWPSSVYGLTSGAMLLLAGSVADIVGARLVDIIGIFFLSCFTLACGLSNTGEQLVVFRAFQGIANALHLPASVALVAAAVPPGRARNVGFACLGLSSPLGFSVGLVVSGIMIEKTGWRSGFYLSGGATLIAAVAAIWTLPKGRQECPTPGLSAFLGKLYLEIDWIGGIIASGGLAILAYVLATLSGDLAVIHSTTTPSLLSLGVVLLIAFPLWMYYRESAGKPALVPNALWKNIPFASTCIMVALSYGVITSMELFSSLYFQEIQNASTLTTSLYLLPNLLTGVLINLTVGIFVHRLPARWLVVISSFLCSLSPFMMALVNPHWSYWYLEVWAQIFAPFSVDVLFTVGLIIVSNSFPEKTQALAGAVFNTVAQFGMSLGVGLCQVVSLGVMGNHDAGNGRKGSRNDDAFDNPDHNAMLMGYRAGFWAMFACMILCGLLAVVGLRKAGKVGLKRE
ncbi:MFS general substrate transporter [Lindgomyces ingoldianus]|uniref:MFS general substrate transporter n=1 Tax=Lindgomyces ingoldianus TaxID=673940 RepID=A0ACB6QEP7_9PLEO|nr:MFS general substrate transporter [Lindgomyces ingoldianus]KAF2465391.1 MFS general substrate transporter [Lindgomyces ingoldianus]